jgi:SAM-dependent methyltransferase
MSSTCPVCEDTDVLKLNQKVKGPHEVNLYECAGCDLHFLDIWDDDEMIISFYEDNEVVFQSNIRPGALKYNEYDRRFSEVLPHVNKKTKLLEIGAGEGHFLRRIQPHVGEAHACELLPPYVASLREQGFHVWDDVLKNLTPPFQYDIVCMYAVLEHIPHVQGFLQELKRWIHRDSLIFIELPNLQEPLVRYYDIPSYRNFFYREYHLYTFSEKSLRLLLEKAGYACETWPIQVASLTNHFHWMYMGHGQGSTNDMVNVTLPKPYLNRDTLAGRDFHEILDGVDDYYRQQLEQNGIGDILACKTWLSGDN